MITYEMTLSIGYANARRKETVTIEDMGYDEDAWNELSDEDKEAELEGYWKDWSSQYVDGGWKKL